MVGWSGCGDRGAGNQLNAGSQEDEDVGRRQAGFLATYGQRLAALGFWLSVLLLYVVYSRQSAQGPVEIANRVVSLLRGSAWGPLLYILIYLVRPLFLFSAALLTVASGLLFGPVWGLLYTTIGSNGSSLVAYVIGQYFGEGLLASEEQGGRLLRYTDRLRALPFETVLTMRFLFFPYDLVSYLAGFLRIDWRPFLLATALGSIPGSIAFVLFGASIEGDLIQGTPSLNLTTLAASALLFLVSLSLSRYVRRREATQA